MAENVTTTWTLAPMNSTSSSGAGHDDFTDTGGLAKHFKVSPRQIRKWKAKKILPYWEMPLHCIRFNIAECDEAMRVYRRKGING